MAEVKWIKIVTDVFDDEKILLIESMPEADAIIVIWFKLLCLAGKQNNSGVFMMGRMPFTEEMFATIFRRPINTVRMALKVFERFGMIEIVNNAVTIPNWEKHQNLDAYEISKEKTRKRVAAHRERQKMLADSNVTCNVTDDVTVTFCNADRKDKKRKEETREEENKSKRENTLTLFQRLAPDYIFELPKHAELYAKTEEWIKYKMERKETYKEVGMKALLRQIENNALTYGDRTVCDLIDESMSNGWKGIIFDRLKKEKQATSDRNKQSGGIDFRQLWDEERGQGR